MGHVENYRMVMPLGAVIALASVAGAVIFAVYASDWGENNVNMRVGGVTAPGNAARDQLNRKAQTELAYYATVIALLLLLAFFHGYQLTKMRL